MQIISRLDLEADPSLYRKVKDALERGDLVCFPSTSGYKIGADLGSPQAVSRMIQAKRRVRHAPALVFVPDARHVDRIADSVTDAARALMRSFWPGPLTLLFEPGESIDPKVRKPLTRAKRWIGVRIPDDPIPLAVVRSFGRPILVSSANLSTKQGATSVAQVKKNFGSTVALLIDAGDLGEGPKSTLVNVTGEAPAVIRADAVPEEKIAAALGR